MTYNIGICICIFIYKVSYIYSFFVIFNCNIFSGLHAKHFEMWTNVYWNWWVDCFIAQSIKWFDILGVHSDSIFPFMQYSFSIQKTVSFGLLVSCLSLSQSVIDDWWLIGVGFFLKISSHSWIILSIPLNEVNLSDWLLKRWWWIFLK